MTEITTQQVADALVRYYEWWRSKYTEDVYGVALYSTALVDYLGCTIFTEQGLEKVVAQYRSQDSYRDESVEQLRRDLRWSPCDSPHHMERLEIFEPLDAAAADWSARLRELEDPDFSAEVDAAYARLLDGVLAFRNRSLPARSEIVTTMFWGDMSEEELLAFVRHCNPADVADAFEADWSVA